MSEIKYEIVERIGTIATSSKDWTTELNLISWNDAKPKYDLRSWDPEHEKMSKGITLDTEAIKNLRDLLNEVDL